ncbi:DNA polymerase I [Clostridium sp. BJN0001]|uniref:DNA polymerase I n=1 Tax=Clostridium sp. BJN0001 TaxID=2930219 RepID=UPI001FD2D007|nr:DNA polymerase I [Clostridium sp. BJN0001]
MKRLLVLDSNSLMNRAFYALPPLTNNDGVNTNAIYGFLNMLLKMKNEINPDSIIAAFDLKAPTFRHKEYDEYKAGRKKMPPELFEQFPIMKELMGFMGIKIFEMEGFEADDIIGTVSKIAEENNTESYIVTGDHDALQLASSTTKVVITKKGVTETAVYDENAFVSEYGITPKQFIDVKGLMGDKSDNIKGVPGVGEKTAFKLIKEYGSIEEVLSNIDKIKGNKLKQNLEENVEQAIFSKKLATIVTNVPIDYTIDELLKNENVSEKDIKNMLIKLNMKSILNKMDLKDTEEKKELDIVNIENLESMKKVFDEYTNEVFLSYGISNRERFSNMELKYMIISDQSKCYYIDYEKIFLSDEENTLSILKAFMENEKIKKIIHSGKNLLTYLNKNNILIKGFIFDTEIASYLIDSSKNKYELSDIIERYLMESIDGKEISDLCFKASYIKELYSILRDKIKSENMEELYYNVEHPLIFVLSSMEENGFKVNTDILDELQKKFKSEIDKTEQIIYDLADEKFNINSPKQLGKILFEKLDLPVIKKTKTGYSTNQEVLEKLNDKHPIISKIMYFRQITKINSTYVEGLKSVVDSDSKIHSSFNQTVTTTGRLSSTEPNLQNIPIRHEMGKEIRKVFIPMEKDDLIVSCDYSQIELRVLAHIADDENMIDAFNNHNDIHTKTASEVFKVPISEVTSLMRSRAKAVNFGIVYGISAFSLSKDLKISKKEAEEYMNIYFSRYPKVKEYLDNIVDDAKKTGIVTTILNRRRFIPEIKSSNKIVKAFGERLAMNAPIQGSAADIIKIAMIKVYNKLKEKNLKSELILQVHDELILNVKKDEFDKVCEIVVNEMKDAVKLKVKLDVDLNYGKTWYDAK